ncbi:putative nuclease HARBI1 [Prorops nasuta]|uniref:putative nuclease HARBI1 n=1 Tax=Prorops nasuta TaxID=863751 RepID=UPI0034CF5C2A
MEEIREVIISTVSLVINEIVLLDTDSDEEENSSIMLLKSINCKRSIPRIENYVEEVVSRFSRDEFKANFRMFPETCHYILIKIEDKLKRIKLGTPTVNPKAEFLLTLWRLGTPNSFRSICERFNPKNDQLQEIFNGFENNSGFPKIIGAIDGTHINIPAPKNYPEAYINRKGHYSIHLQAVCDHKCRFLHCYTGHAGSVHDQRVFRQSEIDNYLVDNNKFPDNSHLLGDSAYKLHKNLLTTYKDNGHLTLRQKNYNFCHSSARMALERAFGLLKGRFRCLLTTFAMNRVDLIPSHIMACCVLHNICLLKDDFLDNEAIELEEERSNAIRNERNDQAGTFKRELISAELNIRIT